MTGRSVPTWSGATPDATIPKRVRLRVFEAYGGVCQLSGRKIMPGDEWDVDHRLPLGLGGAHAEQNLWPVLRSEHRKKTAEDTRQMRKADRVRAKHLGLKKPKTRGLSPPPGTKFDWSKGRYVRVSKPELP